MDTKMNVFLESYLREGERGREGARERQRHRGEEIKREGGSKRETDRQTERERDIEREGGSKRETDRQTERDIEREGRRERGEGFILRSSCQWMIGFLFRKIQIFNFLF
jgi:hypothetical protein